MGPQPFLIKDCALAAIATGIKARTLTEFRDRLEIIDPACIYFHFWIGRLGTAFESDEPHNDFSYWVHHSLHDESLAERIELLDPSAYDLETLRSLMLEAIEHRLDELDFLPSAKKEDQFHFIRSKIIVFKTDLKMEHPKDLVKVLPLLPNSSLFFHFIEARRRTEGFSDDFTVWLKEFKGSFTGLINRYREIDPYFISLTDLKQKVITTTNEFFIDGSS